MVAGHKIANAASVWDCNYWWKLGTGHLRIVSTHTKKKNQTQNSNSKW